jgi:hypothetical protein
VRKSTIYFMALGILTFLLAAVVVFYPLTQAVRYQRALHEQKNLVHHLMLTDLCLFPEARYARHLSQADLHSAFQDHPRAMEHFPSGSLVLPPQHLLAARPSAVQEGRTGLTRIYRTSKDTKLKEATGFLDQPVW